MLFGFMDLSPEVIVPTEPASDYLVITVPIYASDGSTVLLL